MQGQGIRKNIAALMAFQLGNYILPLLLIPYLVRTLGLEVFGQWMFAVAFVIVARTFVAYGFDLTATRTASVVRDDQKALSGLYQTVVLVRMTVWVVCFSLLLLATSWLDVLADVQALVLLGTLILIGEAIFPLWLFQGTETMGWIPKIKLSAKMVNLGIVVSFVRGPDDVHIVPIAEAVTSLVGGMVALIVAAREFGLQFVRLRIADIVVTCRESAPVFLAQAAVHLYSTLNTIVLGWLIGTAAVAPYAIAERVYSALRGILNPVVQALFPGLSVLYVKHEGKFRDATVAILVRIGMLLVAMALVVIIGADVIVEVIAGQADSDTIGVLRIFGFALFFAFGSFLGPMLVVRRKGRLLLIITAAGGGLGLAIIGPMVLWLGASGAALSFLITQIYNSAALMMAALWRR